MSLTLWRHLSEVTEPTVGGEDPLTKLSQRLTELLRHSTIDLPEREVALVSLYEVRKLWHRIPTVQGMEADLYLRLLQLSQKCRFAPKSVHHPDTLRV